MDAVAYQVSFDKEQLALLCANYDRRIDSLGAENKRLKAENVKLRELVRDMYKAFMHGNCYRWCEFKEPCNYISDGRCQWYDRMRELGIETGDGVS